MEDIAHAAGISKGLVYRHFASKDELYISAVLVYLDELGALLEAVPHGDDPIDELLAVASAYMRYGIEHPAFLDCCLSLMRRPAVELAEHVSPATTLRLAQGMARSLRVVAELLRRGRHEGAFSIDDPDAWANYWYTRALGSLHLARIGVILCPDGSPLPTFRAFPADELVRIALEDLLADVGIADPQERVATWLSAVALVDSQPEKRARRAGLQH